MTYIPPIHLSREAHLKRRAGEASACPGGCRRRVERLRAAEHCSKVLLARMFQTLPDAFRFFLKEDDPSFFLSDAQLETCFITSAQLRKGLNELVLHSQPHPAPLSPRWRRAGRGTASWKVDIDDIIEELTIGFRSQLSLLDFMRMFEWDNGLGACTQLQYAANRRLLEYQVRMEIKEKIVVNKWRFLSMAVRARVVYWRWKFLMATFAWNNWREYASNAAQMRREAALAGSHFNENILRCFIKCWAEWTSKQKQHILEQQSNALAGKLESAAQKFLRHHPFIKTPSDAFLAGLAHGAAKIVCLEGEDGLYPCHQEVGTVTCSQDPGAVTSRVPRSEGSLYQFIKSRPLRSSVPIFQKQDVTRIRALPLSDVTQITRPSSAIASGTSLKYRGEGGGGEYQVEVRPSTAGMRKVGPEQVEQVCAPADMVKVYGSGSGPQAHAVAPLRRTGGEGGRLFNTAKAIRHGGYSTRLPLSEEREQYLQIQPAVIRFEGFLNLGDKYCARVEILNVSGTSRRIRVLPPQSRFFVVHFQNDRRLAPGLSTHFEILFTPLEKRSYYDCIHVKTDDGHREYMIPIHAYPGRRMVLADTCKVGPLRHHPASVQTHHRTVQKVWRLEQYALAAVDDLRGSLRNGRLKMTGADGVDLGKAGEDQECERAMEAMQREIQELEKEIFLGPGVEMCRGNICADKAQSLQRGEEMMELGGLGLSTSVQTRDSCAQVAAIQNHDLYRYIAQSKSGFRVQIGVGGRGGGGREPFDMPFDYPLKGHARHTAILQQQFPLAGGWYCGQRDRACP